VTDTVRTIAPSPVKPAREPETVVAAPTPANSSVVHEVMPQVSQKALNTIQGKVRVKVRVNVDSAGNVVSSDFVNPGPSKYFANFAIQAAKGWKFAPAQVESRAWDLQFNFARTEVRAFPTPVTP
jgi:TonB family protein